jgi:uroporphyrinogen decarboxylase
LASHLRGTDLFMDMYDDPDYVKNLLAFCTKVAQQMATFYIQAGMDMIAFVDPLISQISPDDFVRFPGQSFTELFRFVANNNRFSALFVCGDATQNIEPMCQTHPHALFIDENIAIEHAKQITQKYNIVLGGNIPLTTTMLHGTQDDNRQAVVHILDSCSTCHGLIVAPGCDMPYDVPIQNTIAAAYAVSHYQETKQMIAGYNGQLPLDDIEITLPDYPHLPKPLVEIFTLDSRSCAACGYMINNVTELHQEHPNLFDYIEYKYTELANIKRCRLVGVKNLPSLYINGTLAYSSIIPGKQKLLEKINHANRPD